MLRQPGQLSPLLRTLHFFIPESISSRPHDLLRARILVAIDLAFLAVVGLTALLIGWLLDHPGVSVRIAHSVMGGLAVGLVLCLALLRITGSPALAANALVIVIFLSLVAGTALQGGDHSPSLAVYIVVPVTAGLLSGRRAGLGWCAAVIVSWLVFHELGRAGFVFPGVLPPEPFRASQLLNLIISCVAIVSIVVVYETMNSALRQRLADDRAQFEYLARHDPLTNIPNRRLFFDLLETGIRRAGRTKQSVALFIVDLNDFKVINDTFGHAAGDLVLKEVAQRLRGVLRISDAVARLGGDEFAVLVELLRRREDAELVARKIRRELDRPFDVGGETLSISAAVGIALYPEDGSDAESLQEAADTAMYGAKHAGADHRFAMPSPGEGI